MGINDLRRRIENITLQIKRNKTLMGECMKADESLTKALIDLREEYAEHFDSSDSGSEVVDFLIDAIRMGIE